MPLSNSGLGAAAHMVRNVAQTGRRKQEKISESTQVGQELECSA